MHVQDRDAEEGDEQWSLSRFAPLMQEVLEDLASNKLNMDEYPYVQPPTSDSGVPSLCPKFRPNFSCTLSDVCCLTQTTAHATSSHFAAI